MKFRSLNTNAGSGQTGSRWTSTVVESTHHHCKSTFSIISLSNRKTIYRLIMSGSLTIIGLVCLQILRVMSINEYPEKKVQNIWLTDMDDRQPASRIERSDQFETANDVIMKDASVYPKITRRGFAGEEFFLKASKSVPRIGRRNNDIQESPKRSLSKDQVNMVEYWPYLQPNDINDMTRKHDYDLPYNCQQLDAKSIFLVDMYNFVCNDQFYCCAPAKRTIANSLNANNL
ncbi:uncharacterized protein LOC113558462 [Rhopalosiphum maidis]|uniref:uncharacterized protein LOC113558462 n=1 Tax=Rhopalosiphum maidis TaxID=43146 RepID=UPI000EFEDBAC|nr:uncharacterized protein LOC113558462 [Rhopalosiphum maidis]